MPPSYSVMGVGHTQLAENEIRKLQQEVLDSIVDGFGSNVLWPGGLPRLLPGVCEFGILGSFLPIASTGRTHIACCVVPE
jgi:hypothetical protein